MGDVGDYWREHREYKRGVKERMSLKTPTLMERLQGSGYQFTVHNNGEHVRIKVKDQTIDWWPSTARWMHGKKTAFGFGKLMKYLSTLRGDDLDIPF